MSALNDTLAHMDLPDIYKQFYPNATECILFSNVHRIFSKIDHMLGHKISQYI